MQDESKRFLIVKLYALGDILMATPLLTALKRDYPNCEIHWLVDSQYAEALAGNPLIHRVIAYDTGRWRRLMRRGNLLAYFRESITLRKRLRLLRLDAVFNLHADKWWSVWFNAAPERIGVFYRPKVGRLRHLYTKAVPQAQHPRRLHNSEHYLGAAQAFGIVPPYDLRLLYFVSDYDRQEAIQFIARQSFEHPERPLLIFHPGSSRPAKNWLSTQYAELAHLCPGYNIVITGSPSERELAEEIAALSRNSRIAIAAGKLCSLGAAAALIERSAAVVTGDTAALHLASALGTPLIAIYGATRPRSNAPLFGASELLYDDAVSCAPCYLPKCRFIGAAEMACMKAISPALVARVIHRITTARTDKETIYETTAI